MATIVYLDVEDEITSAAARIRGAEESRVALVLPFGSRLATSRINFRLLAREAMTNGKRLDVVAPDASARALAASAGLPVFGSVSELEDALDRPEGPDEATAGTADQGVGPAETTATAAAAAGTPRGAAGRRGAQPDEEPVAAPIETAPAARPRGEPRVVRAPFRLRVGAGALAVAAILALAIVVGGVAAFVFLPAAEITITPRVETIGPVRLTVRADPAATAVDADTGVIPAQTVRIPVQSSGEFQATGKRVDETKATGSVTFDSINTVGPVSVPKGTRLSTIDGVVFVTDQSVIVPRAKVTGNRIEHGVASVGVSALNAGPAGNVDAGTITQAPTFMTTQQVSVTNPAPTTGGTRTETPKVSQQDVDSAVEQLRKDLDAQFATALQDPATVPAGTTLFPTTAALGDPTPSVDPATIVGQEVPSFSLAMSATGDVLAVDATPVKAIAEAKLQGSVSNGYGLVPGSITVSVGNGEVVDGVIRFTADGSARQVRQVDAAALKRQVLGLGADQARALLAPYGEVRLSLWPGWVSSVPTLDQRVTLTVGAPADETPSGSSPPAPSAAASQTPATTVPAGTGGSQPVPSG